VYDFINDLIDKQGSRVTPKSKYRTSKSSFRQSLIELANAQNENIPAERRVSQHTILAVAERALSSTPNLESDTRRFIAYKEAASFVSFAATAEVTNTSLEKYYDLLPVGHPASTRKHAMTASAFRHTRARWVAADPRLDESVREIVAAAYMYESNTVEYSHAITRLTALTAASVPRDIFLSALTAAFSFGDGNSSAARRARANLQWRDRMGRWIEMGRGIGFRINIGSSVVPVNGKFIGVDGDRGLVQVKGDQNLEDGIYPIESNNAQAYKALLPDSVVKGKVAGKLSSIFDKRAQIPNKEDLVKMRMDAPFGWKKNEDGSFGSDDDYIVEESDGKLALFRKDKNGDKGAQVGESVDDWAQVQDLANADEKDYDKFKRIMSSPSNADVLPGTEKDPYDNLNPSAKAVLEEMDAKKEKDKAFFEEKRKQQNEDIDKFEEMFEQGKDIEGRDIPEGWEVVVNKYGTGPSALEIRSFQKIVPSKDGKGEVQVIAEINSDGKINFGHRADWFNKDGNALGYDTWEEAEAQIPRVVDWVGDSKSLMHDPENPWYKDSIGMPKEEELKATLPDTSDYNAKIFNKYEVDLTLEKYQYEEIGLDPDKDYTDEEVANAWIKAQGLEGRVILDKVERSGAGWPKVSFLVEPKDKEDFAKAYGYDSWSELNDDYGFDDPLPELTDEQKKKIDAEIRNLIENPPAPTEMDKRVEQLLKEQREEYDKAKEAYYAGFFDKDGNRLPGPPADGGDGTTPPEGPSSGGSNTPGAGFSDYVIDLASGNRFLDKDLQEQLDVDVEELAVDFIENAYEDAGDVYDLAQDIKDNKPEGMSDKEFIDDAAAQMRKNLEAIVDSAIEDRKDLVESGDQEPIDFDKETFINIAIERYKELVQEELDNMDEDGDDDGDGGGTEPTAPEPTSPEAPAAETPAVEEVSQEVISKLEAPKGAWKLQSPEKFEPEGRVDDEMSPDFSDDPEVLAGKFGEDALVDGFIQAVIGKKDYALDLLEDDVDDEEVDEDGEPVKKKKGPGAPKKKVEKGIQGFGVGALEFNQGEEWVPAEALYLALKKQGYDVDLLLAQLYDSGLGENKNQDLLKSLRKEETVEAQTPLLDAIDLEDAEVMARVNAEVAAPGPAGAVMAQLEEINKNGEPNKNIVDLADRVRKESKEPSGSALSEDMPEAFVKMLEDYIGWANSDDLDEKQAFQALWGAIMALDGGLSDGKEETSVQRAVSDALEKYNGTTPSYEEVQQFFADNGKFTDLMRSKKALVDGNESLDDSQSFAGAYYRLIAEAGRYNEFSLHRGIQVPADSEFIQNLKKGNALAFDARPFSKDRNTAAMFAGVLSKGSLDKAAVVFKIAPLKGKSVDMASISPFPDEQEQVVWGNFKIVSVKKSKNSYDKPVYEVEVERITKRDAILDGYDDSYESLLMSENNSPEMPEGYHQIDTAPYQSIGGEGYPGGFEDRPDVVAKNYERDSLVEVFRGAIEDGSGEATLEWDGEEISVPVELIRDALQIQGIDTNSVLDDIANADPDSSASDEADTEPAEQNLDNPVDEIVADVSAEYDMSGWKKTGPQLGSNEGGFYEDTEGNRFYVKKPKSDLHAENEVLAAALYKLLGVNAAEIGIGSGEDGVKMTFSPDIIGSKQDLQKKLNDPEYLAKLQEGFAIDAWLGNWDVAGLAFDNVMSDGDGNPVRVDPGGALLFRAMGKPKGTLFGNEVNELDSLRDENMNPQSAAVFGSMSEEQQKESARKLLDISNDDIGSMVDGIITDEKAAEELKTKLKARRQFILDRYDLLSEDTSVIVDNADISEEQDADPEAVMSPEGVKGEIDQAMDTAAGWAQEYADDEDLLPSQRKNFQKVSDQIDSAMVDWRNGEISDEELSGVLQELIDFNESWPWDTKDPNIMNKVDDISEQLQALKNVVDDYNKANAPEGATPEPVEEAPVSAPEPSAPISAANPLKDKNGAVIKPGTKLRYEKKGVVLEGVFSRYDKSPLYVVINFGDGKKPKAMSLKYVTVIDGEGGGGGGPKAPEAPESPEPTGTETPTPETPTQELLQDDIGQYEPTAQLTEDGKKVRVSFIVDGNRPFNPKGDGPAGYEEVLPYVVDSKLDVDGVDEVTVEIPLEKMDEFNKTYKSVFDESIVPEEFYGDIYTDYQEPVAEPKEEPAAVKPSASTPFPTEPILNEAADELVKLFSYGMPEGGKILAVHEKDGMIAATPDGETVYIIDAKKKTNYTPEAKPDFFEPGGNGIEVFQWRQPTKEESDALLEKIAQNKSEPYGTESEPVEDVDSSEELEVPEGFTAIDDSKGKKIFAGVKVADKDGVVGTVTKVNKDNYALVDFGDGTVKWRSGKTLNSTGEVDENFKGSTTKAAPKTKTTGAGAAPVIVDSPADWKLSNFESVPALPDAIAKALDTSSPKAAMQGASAAVDADSIEDLDVRVIHVRDENGVDNIQLKFKLTNWAGKKRIAEIAKMNESERVEAGIQVEPLRIQRINVGPDGVGQISPNENAFTNSSGRTYTITTDDGIVIRIHRANADSGDQFSKSYGETPARAFHNTVQIQAPVGATDDQIANALALAGVSEVRPATPDDAKILIENRLMSIFDAQTDANTNLKGEKRVESLENVKNKWGLTVDDVEVVTGASGRIEYRLSEEGAKKIWEATGKPEALYHGLRNPGVLSYTMTDEEKQKAMIDWIVGFVDNPQGGLLSTTTRWTEGVGGHGQSSTADIGTGGADYVFTRPTKSADKKRYGTSDWVPTLYFDPIKAYQRLDFYANYTDAFGKRSKNKDVISAAKVGAYEVMFKHRLAWDDLDVMVVSKEMHPGIIEGLKARGIDSIGGRPIEDVIIISTGESKS
jgi:hypothetical protein